MKSRRTAKITLILAGSGLIAGLLGLSRISTMRRMEELGVVNFEPRDYVARMVGTFLFAALFLSLNVLVDRIRLGSFVVDFSRIPQVVYFNLACFALIQVLLFGRMSARPEFGARSGAFFGWNLLVNAAVVAVCALMGVAFRYIRENLMIKLANESLKKENAEARFANLKDQLNPHFMFNSFSTLNGLIEESPERAQRFLLNMSDMYRYVLKVESTDLVSLGEELQFAERYVEMMKERFGEAIQLERSTTYATLPARVLPLSIQVLIENAVKHNSFDNHKPLRIEILTDYQHVEVRNNLRFRPSNGSANHQIGLYNLNQRYKHLADKEIIITKSAETFSVKIPLLS